MFQRLITSPGFGFVLVCLPVLALAFLAALMEHGLAAFHPIFLYGLLSVVSVWLIYAGLGAIITALQNPARPADPADRSRTPPQP